jgi:hypothetical protein
MRDVQRASALLEIGPVVSPAYAATNCEVAVRSVQELLGGMVVVPKGASVNTRAIRSRLAVARMKAYAVAR